MRRSDIERRAKKILTNPKIDRETKEAVRRAQESEPFRLFCSAVFNAEEGRKMKPTGEPKDRLSNEWRHWKLRQFEQAFNSGELETYTAAWTEFRDLLRGLMADGNFWHTSHATELLPHLLSIRQYLDGQSVSLMVAAAKTQKGARR